MIEENNKISVDGEFTLFDDEGNREKHKVMDKFDIVCDDSRNENMLTTEKFEEFLQWGKSYKITIALEEINNEHD